MARLLAMGFSMSLRRSLAFRANLFFDLAVYVAGLAAEVATILLVFTRTDQLAGWTQAEALVLAGTYRLLSGAKQTFLDPNLSWFPGRGIRDGNLDTYLLQPAPSLFLTSFATAAPLALVQAVLGLGVVLVGVGSSGRTPTPLGVAAWLVLLVVGATLTWALGVLLACLAFWAPRLELEVLYGAVWQLGRYPVDVYRRPVRMLLTYVVPLALIASLPASVLLREPGPTVVLTSIGAGVVAVFVAGRVWRLGLRRYTGATS